MDTYLGCPHRYMHTYVKRTPRDKTKRPRSWRYGTCVHAGLEGAYLALAKLRERPDSMLAVRREALDAFLHAWDEEDMPTEHGELDRGIEELDACLERLPVVDPSDVIGVEYCIDSSTPDGALVIGYVDLMLRTGPKSLKVVDHKVTGHASTQEEILTDRQLNTYAWLLQQEFPWAEEVTIGHHYPTQGSKEVSVLSLPEYREDAILEIEATVEMIETDTTWEPKPSERCEHCPFKQVCPAWTEKQAALAEVADF